MNITEPYFDEEEIRQVRECLASRWVTQGPRTAEFERLFASRHGVDHALATTSCTAALHLSCLALGLGPGDEVIVPAFTWVTSAHAVEYVGAKVVFADVEASTFNLNPSAFESAITSSTRAVVVVHLFGLAARMEEILAIAQLHGLAVIEDAACAVGTTYKGQPVGAIGDIGCFSFHPRKVITTGEGGMVTTNREDLAQRVKYFRNHGATGILPEDVESHGPWTMGTFNMLGFNLRMSDIQAAIGVAQMGKLDRLLGERRSAALRYSELLKEIENDVVLPTSINVEGHTFQSYVIRVRKGSRQFRNAIMAHLAQYEIQTRPGTHAVHRLGYYREKYKIDPACFPEACACEDTTITLPIFPGITEEQQAFVVDNLRAALRKG